MCARKVTHDLSNVACRSSIFETLLSLFEAVVETIVCSKSAVYVAPPTHLHMLQLSTV